MRWEALKGVLVGPVPERRLDHHQLRHPGGHFPTFATPWTSTTATRIPIEDLWALGAVALPASGIYLSRTTCRSPRSGLHAAAQSPEPALELRPRRHVPEGVRRPRASARGLEIVATDDGWTWPRTPRTSLNKWIADGKVFTTTPTTATPAPIGEIKDGWVLVGAPGADQPVARQGMQSEWIYDRVRTSTRCSATRRPHGRAVRTEALAWGTAY
jgi:hypothetical protein